MNETAEVVIIGGGAIGCSIAYHLAEQGCKDIVVCEKSYLGSGSSGRCAGGVRQLWGLETNCRFVVESVKEFKVMHEIFNFDVEYHQCGYLTLATEEGQAVQLKKNIELWRTRVGGVEFFTPQQVKELSPKLNTEGIYGAIYSPTDGWANPFRVIRGYAETAKKMGVRIYTFTEVVGVETENGRVVSVVTDRGKIYTPVVVNAAGGYSQLIGKMAGVELPTYSERHQIFVTEPLAPVLEAHINVFKPPVYIKQTKHGNLIMGSGEPQELPSYNLRSTWQFLTILSSFVVKLIPAFKNVSVIRQWSGLYDMSRDHSQILSEVPNVRGFILAVGFSGHGFMVAPAVGKVVAELILRKELSIPIDELRLQRFEEGKLLVEALVN